MSLIARPVPKAPANTPIIIKITFLINMYLNLPKLLGYKMHISIKAGNAIPSADKHNAPNKDMNKFKYGIATASKTETNIIKQIEILSTVYYVSKNNY